MAHTTPYSATLLALYCNNIAANQVVETLEDKQGQIWLDKKTLDLCHLQNKKAHKIIYDHKQYYLLNDIVGNNYHVNNEKSTIDINIPVKNYPSNNVFLNKMDTTKIRPKRQGLYLNYDLTAQKENLTDTNNLSGLSTLNYFNKNGVGEFEYFLQNINNKTTSVRLDTNWTLDEPEKAASWRFGDSITGTDIWTGAVRFGGIQYATNFATQPNYITFPLPSVKGQAVVPTSVDFYLNNQLLNSQNVNSGAFDIQGLPVITGAGDILVQTKDITGKQTVVAVPYYASASLLQKGLSSFSYDLGMIRNDYGIESNNYSDPTGVVSYKKGLSNDFTAGVHSEILAHQQDIGLSGAYNLNNLAIVNTAIAASNNESKQGGLLLAGIQRQTPRYSLGFQAETTSEDFWQLGLTDDELSPKFLLQSSASINSQRYGTLSVSYTNRVGRTEPVIGIATFGYNLPLGKKTFLSVNYTQQFGNDKSKQLYINFIYTPAPSYTANVAFNKTEQSGDQGYIQFSKNLPTNNGIGYSVSQTTGGDPQTQANLIAQSTYGQYQAKYSHVDSTDNYEVDVNGAIVLFANQLNATRQITNSFALVNLPGQANVPIYFSNQPIVKTNKDGYAFIPNIQAYQDNVISINPNDLPLNDTIEKTKIDVKPYYHSGVLIQFPMQQTYNYDLFLKAKNNDILAPGNTVYIESLKKSFPIGYHGEVFITSHRPINTLSGIVRESTQLCRFSINIPKNQDYVQQLGEVKCQ